MTARRLMPVTTDITTLPAAPPVQPDAAAYGVDAVDTLARTLWGEAQGEPVRGIEAVAAVIVNRLRRADARGAPAVRRESLRYSCWAVDFPDRPRMLAVDGTDPVFATCLRVARRAVAGVLPDPTGGATRYHRAGDRPDWAEGLFPTAEIGGSLFYGGED
ncbi:cell wall hydrolase [Azospirillum sp. RWY-5-1]|uniref:Cell wall hydrolase n=1 Tax=Azospirillum oleiclasticum TaxID=2735135 RepID=A0ABX2T8A7_9PROT|nr:cell wall hydrolase [Azospirillum oleiclasticum]NYZ12903.1 cell wall hydrolase [Azospirillum oleiclasticum]NYZ20424.1 cell wall hydrolase [Azospirillum oleiclasticum]